MLAVQGATNILIPVTILDGTPAVGGEVLQFGSYIYLMKPPTEASMTGVDGGD